MEAAALRGYLSAAIDCRQVTPWSTYPCRIDCRGFETRSAGPFMEERDVCRYHGRRCPPGQHKRTCYEDALVR